MTEEAATTLTDEKAKCKNIEQKLDKTVTTEESHSKKKMEHDELSHLHCQATEITAEAATTITKETAANEETTLMQETGTRKKTEEKVTAEENSECQTNKTAVQAKPLHMLSI